MDNEFNFIKKKLRPLTFENKEARGLSDDCAFFESFTNVVISVDTSIEGVHIPLGTDISIQARRSILRALSDLSTFGSNPMCIFTAISLPRSYNTSDFEKIADGFKKALIEYEVFLAGGDITSHSGLPIFSITALGERGNSKLGRNKAKEGDLIVVSGSIGDSFIGLKLLNDKNLIINFQEDEILINNFLIPNPKIELGKSIKNFATSIIDISDGLLSELNHICTNSGVGAEIYINDIPFSPAAKKYIESKTFSDLELITGGDDYELLYTIDPKDINLLDQSSYIIGKIMDGNKLNVYSKDNNLIDIDKSISGYQHF